MTFQKTYRLMVTPQTHDELVGGEDWVLRPNVTDEYLLQYGQRKHDEQKEKGSKKPVSPKYWYNMKYRFLRYVKYKQDLKAEAQRVLYMPRLDNVWIKYFIPMPKSWSRKKKNRLDFELHRQTPDRKNLDMGLEDALLEQDKEIADSRSSKFWVDSPFGWIDIEIGTLPPAVAVKTRVSFGTDELK